MKKAKGDWYEMEAATVLAIMSESGTALGMRINFSLMNLTTRKYVSIAKRRARIRYTMRGI